MSLYNRNENLPLAKQWADFVEIALYNLLTKTMFVDKLFTLVAEQSEQLLKVAKGPNSAVMRDCAKVALDCHAVSSSEYKPALLETKTDLLLEPWRSLRLKQESIGNTVTNKIKAYKNSLTKSINKLNRQFLKLKKTENITPYTVFAKNSAALLDMAKTPAQTKVFKAINALASIIRLLRLKRKSERESIRNTFSLSKNRDFLLAMNSNDDPAVRALVILFLYVGRETFGNDWEKAVKVQILNLDNSLNPDVAKAVAPFFSENTNATLLKLLDTAKRSLNWSGPELYLLSCLSLLFYDREIEIIESEIFRDDNEDDSLDKETLKEYQRRFNSISKLAELWRPEQPSWPNIAIEIFEGLLKKNPEIYHSLSTWRPPLDYYSDLKLIFLFLTSDANTYITDYLKNSKRILYFQTYQQIILVSSFILEMIVSYRLKQNLIALLDNFKNLVGPRYFKIILESCIALSLIYGCDLAPEEFSNYKYIKSKETMRMSNPFNRFNINDDEYNEFYVPIQEEDYFKDKNSEEDEMFNLFNSLSKNVLGFFRGTEPTKFKYNLNNKIRDPWNIIFKDYKDYMISNIDNNVLILLFENYSPSNLFDLNDNFCQNIYFGDHYSSLISTCVFFFIIEHKNVNKKFLSRLFKASLLHIDKTKMWTKILARVNIIQDKDQKIEISNIIINSLNDIMKKNDYIDNKNLKKEMIASFTKISHGKDIISHLTSDNLSVKIKTYFFISSLAEALESYKPINS